METTDCCPICYEDFTDTIASIDLEAATAATAADVDDSSSFQKQRINIAAYHQHRNGDSSSSSSSSNTKTSTSSSSSSCQHVFCRACLREYCQHAILTRQIPIPCPARDIAAIAAAAVVTADSSFTKKSKKSSSSSSSSSSIAPPPPRCIVSMNSAAGCQAILSEALIQEVLRDESSSSPDVQSKEREDEPEEEEVFVGDNIKSVNNENDNGNNNNPYWIKFQRFQKLAQDPSLVACPLCNELVGREQQRDPNEQKQKNDEYEYEEMGHQQQHQQAPEQATASAPSWSTSRRFCIDCNLAFCAQHGHLLHAPNANACTEYTQQQEQKSSEQDSHHQVQQMTEQTLRAYTKPCSHCGCRLQKFAGCDHVVCPACQQDMCFRCGTHVYLSSPPIKMGKNNNGQQQQQQQQQEQTNNNSMYRHCDRCKQGFIDHRYAHRHQCRMLLYLPLYLPFMILYTVFVGLVILPLTGFFCCCCGCGYLVENEPLAPPPQPPLRRQPKRTGREQDNGRSAAANIDGADTRPALSPMRGILFVTCIVFLPFLLVLHDFGWESDFVDGLFNNNQQPRHNNRNDNDGSSSSSNNNNNRRVVIGVSEIPTMDLEDVSNNNDDTPDDIDDLDDDVSGIVELVNDDDSFARVMANDVP